MEHLLFRLRVRILGENKMSEFFQSVQDVVECAFFVILRAVCVIFCFGCICSAAYHVLLSVLAEGPGDFFHHLFMGVVNVAFVRYFFFSKN